MTAGETTLGGTDPAPTDQTGKVFIVVGQDLRQCLICEGVYTRQAAFEHATVLCLPGNVSEALKL